MDETDVEKLRRRLDMLERADYAEKVAKLKERIRRLERGQWMERLVVLLWICLGLYFFNGWLDSKKFASISANSVTVEALRVATDSGANVVYATNGSIATLGPKGRVLISAFADGPVIRLEARDKQSVGLELRNGKLMIVRRDANLKETLKPLE
jgi:hypothetical protein